MFCASQSLSVLLLHTDSHALPWWGHRDWWSNHNIAQVHSQGHHWIAVCWHGSNQVWVPSAHLHLRLRNRQRGRTGVRDELQKSILWQFILQWSVTPAHDVTLEGCCLIEACNTLSPSPHHPQHTHTHTWIHTSLLQLSVQLTSINTTHTHTQSGGRLISKVN